MDYKSAQDRVSVALDTKSCDEALRWAETFAPYNNCPKVGKILHSIAGRERRDIVEEVARYSRVFLDLKGHDTPDTIRDCAIEWTRPEVYMWNIHITGGEAMCQAALEGNYAKYQEDPGTFESRPLVIGVTRLTSLDDMDLKVQGSSLNFEEAIFLDTQNAIRWGLDGIVCPAKYAGLLERELGNSMSDHFRLVTPGIKIGSAVNKGQKQVYTPENTVAESKRSMLVIGSGWTKSANPVETARTTLENIANIMYKKS